MRFLIKKTILSFLAATLFTFYIQPLSAQHLTSIEKKAFVIREDSLKPFANNIVLDEDAGKRLKSDSIFTRTLVRALKIKNSFYFPFDSLQTISRLYSPDSAFRIFTWQLKKDEYVYLQRGAIQMRTADGSLKLFGLHDVSMFTAKPRDSIRTMNNWIGAIYYRIILKTYNGKKIYTLLGFDDYTISSNKKWMEILTFNDQGEPVFGGAYFSFKDDSVTNKKIIQTPVRFNIEYKKEANTTLNYDPEMDMIIFDELISESEEPDRRSTFVPDGDFEGFKWQDGQWLHVPRVFNFVLKDGQFPQDEKILDEAGGANEQKLMDQSDKNIQKKQKQKTSKPVK